MTLNAFISNDKNVIIEKNGIFYVAREIKFAEIILVLLF